MLTDAALSIAEVRRGLSLRSADASVAEAALVVLAAFAAPAAAVRMLTDLAAPGWPPLLVLLAGTAGCAVLYALTLYARRRRLALGEIAAALRRRPADAPAPTRSGSAGPPHRSPGGSG
jgi:hypothetical protein